MITHAFLSLLYRILIVLISPFALLPDVSLSSNLTSSITTASGYISSFSAYFPVSTALQVFAAMLVIELATLTYKLIMWVLTKIPGISN